MGKSSAFDRCRIVVAASRRPSGNFFFFIVRDNVRITWPPMANDGNCVLDLELLGAESSEAGLACQTLSLIVMNHEGRFAGREPSTTLQRALLDGEMPLPFQFPQLIRNRLLHADPILTLFSAGPRHALGLDIEN
jgi:hypothetical protein